MTRIIGGLAGGRRLATPPGEATRPTSDRVREAMFSSIESWCGSLQGLRVLDLYAGSGALGLEAWSRGAARVQFVEADRRTAALIVANARSLGCEAADVVTGSVATVLGRGAPYAFDLVMADPPYPMPGAEVEQMVSALAGGGWLAVDALVLVERPRRRGEFAWPPGFEPGRDKRYGETVVHRATWPGETDTAD